jgi:hypothetical protein
LLHREFMQADSELAGLAVVAYHSFHCINALVHYEAPIDRP